MASAAAISSAGGLLPQRKQCNKKELCIVEPRDRVRQHLRSRLLRLRAAGDGAKSSLFKPLLHASKHFAAHEQQSPVCFAETAKRHPRKQSGVAWMGRVRFPVVRSESVSCTRPPSMSIDKPTGAQATTAPATKAKLAFRATFLILACSFFNRSTGFFGHTKADRWLIALVCSVLIPRKPAHFPVSLFPFCRFGS